MTAHPSVRDIPRAEPTLGPGPVVIGVDVGGTTIKAALTDATGRIGPILRCPTPRDAQRPGQRVVEEVGQLVDTLRGVHAGQVSQAVGLTVPGLVDDARGVGILSTNLGWRDAPLADWATQRLGLPVRLGHDVATAGLAECRLGAAAGHPNSAVVIIGTGVAAALTLDGRPYRGGGLAGEIGHLRVADGPACACGAVGCLEAIASASAIARRYAAATGRAVDGAAEVLAAVAVGDPMARTVWEQALDALALGLSHVATLLAPTVIVLGGGLAEAGPQLVAPLEERLETLVRVGRRPALTLARFGSDAGVTGALLLARDLAHEAPVLERPVMAMPGADR